MIKKFLLGCSAFVMMVAIGIAVAITLVGDWRGSGGGKGSNNDPNFLRQQLAKEFSRQPEVEFVCRFPVVGPAPCILDSDMGSREVTLTFINYELPRRRRHCELHWRPSTPQRSRKARIKPM
jgi:hypothetical protein